VATLLMIGTRKGLWLARSDDRASWQLEGPLLAMHEVKACAIDARRDPGGPPRLLAGGHHWHWGPTLQWSDDFGASWSDPEHAPIRFGPEEEAAVHAVWQIRPDVAGRDGVVWAGTEPSALWRSDDGGESFTLVRGLWDHPDRPHWEPGGGGQALHTILPHPDDPARVAVAMSAGGVYRTEDGGETWRVGNHGMHAAYQPDPTPEYGYCVHKVARDAVVPDRLYAQHHGGVYRSDKGEPWVAIDAGLPADFGFPIVAHPRAGDTAYVFPLTSDEDRTPPGKTAAVYRTRDAGASWECCDTGLPHSFHVSVLRDAMCVDDADPAGIYVGARDGSVFASNNEGESWHEVARHLPDVLCVRAAAIS
jgi:hypothetical protein